MRQRRQRWVSNEGARLYTHSEGQGTPIVCVHGGPGAGHEYLLPGLAGLSDEFRVIFYDQRDAGASHSADAPVTLRHHLCDLDSVLDVQEVEGGVLVGHSWGAVLTLLYASTHPERVAGVVLTNAVSVDPSARWEFAMTVASRLESPEFDRYCAQLSESDKAQPSLRERIEFARVTWGLFHRIELAGLLPYFTVGRPQNEALWEEAAAALTVARRVAIPCLILQGEHDPTPLDAAVQFAASVCGDPEVMRLPRCAHMAPMEAGEALDQAVRVFTAKHVSGFEREFRLAAQASG